MGFEYYMIGFWLGIAIGRGYGEASTRNRISRLTNESIQKSYQIKNYQKFIKLNGLNFKYSQYEGLKEEQKLRDKN